MLLDSKSVMDDALPDLAASEYANACTALQQTLEFLRSEQGKSHQGYFGPGGWAYERLLELLKSLE